MALKRTILYIDDDPCSVPLVRWALASLATLVLWTCTGASGLEMACAHQPDLILVSGRLPDMDGCAVARRLRELMHTPGCWRAGTKPAIMLLTSEASADAIAGAFAAGVDRYVVKPIDARDLWRQAALLLSH